ncbi:MAG: hypothetical protein RR364_03890 [Lachnospiraceae bacterium]
MAKQRNNTTQQNYIYGNAAPQFETAAEYNRRKTAKPETSSARAVRRNRENAKCMNLGYVLFLCMATSLVFGICAIYVNLQAQVNERMEHINTLENQLVDLQADNDTAFKRLQTSVNLNQIRKTAAKKLGMVYPKEEQIIYYEVENSDYMEQVEEIPQASRRTVFDLIFNR